MNPPPAPSPLTPLHGLWRVVPSPSLTEILAQSGFDFQILDCEHGAYDYASLLNDILACELHGCAPFVRVSGTSKVEVQRCLDLGARGIVFPQLSRFHDFAAAASMMDYAPAGTRGFNPFVRAGAYGSSPTPLTRPWFTPIVETREAVDQIEAILKIDRIDLVYIGSYDLSAQLGVTGQMDAAPLVQAVDRILAACRHAGKPASLMVLSDDDARKRTSMGVQALVHGVDSHRLKRSMTQILAPLHELRLPTGTPGLSPPGPGRAHPTL